MDVLEHLVEVADVPVERVPGGNRFVERVLVPERDGDHRGAGDTTEEQFDAWLTRSFITRLSEPYLVPEGAPVPPDEVAEKKSNVLRSSDAISADTVSSTPRASAAV